MRSVVLIAALAALLPSAAYAQDKCGQLQIVNRVQLLRAGNVDLVPVSINGTRKIFVFDTGGSLTQVSRPVAEELKLPVRQGNIQMYDLTGKVSSDQAAVKEFMVGHMRGADQTFPITPGNLPYDGIFALDHWTSLDLDVDFGTDMLSMFSQDHCPGRIQYWTAPALAVVPIHMDGFHMIVPVTIDGQPEKALIDTGAIESALTIDEAKRLFDITPGGADSPENGVLNGDQSLKTYGHKFKSLSFGDVAVNNPQFTLIPDAMGKNMDRSPLTGSRVKTARDLLHRPDMIIGMNVLRKLHLYIAFGERKLYVTDATPSAQPAAGSVPQ